MIYKPNDNKKEKKERIKELKEEEKIFIFEDKK